MEENKNPQGLNFEDMILMSKIIDACTERGAFKANELATVGDLYNRLNAFVSAYQKAQDDKAPAKPEVASPATAETPAQSEPVNTEAVNQ